MGLVAFCSLLAIARSGIAAGQAPETTGLVLGVSASAVSADSDSTTRGTGAVLGAMLGFSLAPRTILYFDFDVGAVRDTTARMIGHADFVGRLLFGKVGRWHPYAEAGLATRIVELSDERDLLGMGLMLGIGSEVPLRAGRNLDVALIYWRGSGDDVRQEGRTIASDLETNAHTLRLRLGYRWRDPTSGQRPRCPTCEAKPQALRVRGN
jgi:hypothetical protein